MKKLKKIFIHRLVSPLGEYYYLDEGLNKNYSQANLDLIIVEKINGLVDIVNFLLDNRKGGR